MVTDFNETLRRSSSRFPRRREFLVLALLAVSLSALWYFFGPQAEKIMQSVAANIWAGNASEKTAAVQAKNNCGEERTRDLVFKCLGASALACENAQAAVASDLFPTNFEIIKNQNSPNACSFKLSYAADSSLLSVTGKKLAGQYIFCPLLSVKGADKNDPVKYAEEIYAYGTIGVFSENNLDKDKIKSSGCSGTFIDSVLESYSLYNK